MEHLYPTKTMREQIPSISLKLQLIKLELQKILVIFQEHMTKPESNDREPVDYNKEILGDADKNVLESPRNELRKDTAT